MKLRKRLISFVLACAVTVASLFVPVGAATKTVVWDGKTAFVKGINYTINSRVNVKADFTLPEGVLLTVKSGGYLKISAGVTARIKGTINVQLGGTLHVSGLMDIRDTSVVKIKGTMLTAVGSLVKVKGSLKIFSTDEGLLKTSGSLNVYKGGQIYNAGTLCITSSGSTKVSGTFYNTKTSTVKILGTLACTLSSVTTVNGTVRTMKDSMFKISGGLIIGRYCYFNGTYSATKSAVVSDRRITYNINLLYSDALSNKYQAELHGIDVSYAQSNIDWEKVAATGIDFVMIRCGRGDTGEKPIAVDTKFEQNLAGAQQYGIDAGVYFYSYAETVAQIREEAEFIVELLKGRKLQFPVAIDLEESYQHKIEDETLEDMIDAFCTIMCENGYYPMVYSYKGWLQASGLSLEFRNKYSLWYAQVSDKVTYDGNYYIWQYSCTGKVDGISGNVDLDICYRDFASFIKDSKFNNN